MNEKITPILSFFLVTFMTLACLYVVKDSSIFNDDSTLIPETIPFEETRQFNFSFMMNNSSINASIYFYIEDILYYTPSGTNTSLNFTFTGEFLYFMPNSTDDHFAVVNSNEFEFMIKYNDSFYDGDEFALHNVWTEPISHILINLEYHKKLLFYDVYYKESFELP